MNVWKTRLSLLLLCQVVLAGGLWAFSYHREASQTQSTYLFDFRPEDIDKIELTQGEQSLLLTKSNGSWLLPDHDQLPASQNDVDNLLKGVKELTVREPETTTESSHHRLGVSEDDAGDRVKLYAGEDLVVDLLVGKAPVFDQRYLRVAGSEETYRAEGRGLNVRARGAFWLDKGLLSSGPIERFIHPEFELVREGDQWRSGETELDQEKVDALLGHLERLKVVDIAHEVTASEQTTEVTVETREGHTYKYSLFEQNGKYYITRDDLAQVFEVPENDAKSLTEANLKQLFES